MAYIGVTVQNQLNPAFLKEDFVGNGSATQFTLTNEVPGANAVSYTHLTLPTNDLV